MTKLDTYQDVTNAIVAQLEAGTKPWQKDWIGGGAGFTMPRRATGEYYRGINVLLLWGAVEERGFRSDRWLTFKQALELGGAVRKGEKGTRIVFFKKLEVADRDSQDGDTKQIPMLRAYTVFNADQVDGLPEGFANVQQPLPSTVERDEAAEAILRSCGASIRENGDKAFYAPGPDLVNMPTFDRFRSAGGFLATLAHELCHWTGHETRLARQQANKFGSKDYAYEELVAEIGAAFVGARLGIVGEHIDNHAAYLASWLKALKDDKRMIFRAASAAQAAADMVLANAGEQPPAPVPIAAPIQVERAEPMQLALL